MPRGCRNGYLTKVNLAARLAGAAVPGASEIKPEKASARALLGHAIFHKVVSDFEVAETVERKESTVPCYLFTHVQHSGQRDAIETYVVAASQLFRRGTIIANLMAMGRVGSSSDEDRLSSQRPRFTSDVAFDIGDAMTDVVVGDSDVRNSVVKQVFLPERWPTATVPRDPEITAVLDAYGDLVPRLPDWAAVMGTTGWDNAINQMATKFAGNVKVHVKKNLLQSVCKYLDTASLHDAASRNSVIDVVRRRLRPLAIHDEDYEMVVLLRRALGVQDVDITWYPPTEVGAVTRDVLTLHLFLVRQGVCGRSYLPVATRGRKYCYLDTKILTPLFAGTTDAVTALLSKSAKAAYDKAKKAKEKKKAKAKAASGAGPSRPTENEVGTEDVVNETASVSVGEMLEITGHSFNAKRKKLRQTLRRRYRKTSSAETPGRKKRRLRRLAQCWARSGSGRLRSGTRIDSVETDGVGLRLCVKTPVDMRPFIVQVPLPSQEASTSSVGSGGPRKKKSPKSKGVPDDFVPAGDDGAAPPHRRRHRHRACQALCGRGQQVGDTEAGDRGVHATSVLLRDGAPSPSAMGEGPDGRESAAGRRARGFGELRRAPQLRRPEVAGVPGGGPRQRRASTHRVRGVQGAGAVEDADVSVEAKELGPRGPAADYGGDTRRGGGAPPGVRRR